MRRIGWAARFLVIVNLLSLPLVARAGGDADQILVEWQKRMAKVTTIEAHFRLTEGSQVWGEKKSEGRVILASPNLALFELVSLDPAGKTKEYRARDVWTGSDFLSFNFEQSKVFRSHEQSSPKDPPVPLCVPFLFQMSVERVKELYEWSFVKETADQVLIAAVNRNKVDNPGWPKNYYIVLSKSTYLPLKVLVGDKADRQAFELFNVLVNAPIDPSELKVPCLDSWEVVEGFGKVFRRWFLR